MPVLDDPESVLPKKGPKFTPAEIISWLLYPVVFLVGLSIGIVVGIKQGQEITANPAAAQNRTVSNAKIVQNTNAAKNTNAVENTNASFLNTNVVLQNGDYLKIDATTDAKLKQDEQKDLNSLVDETASFTDIIRQQDIIRLKYNLKAYYAVRQAYPTTSGQQIRLNRGTEDVFYQAMKEFYGGNYFQKVDPESPTYYYGYTSDGQTFQLTAYLVSKKKAFVQTDQ